MNSRISMKTLSRRLILISAAILINANTVLAANHGADPQMQARDLLAGTVGGRSKFLDKSLPTSADTHQQSYPEPQIQARQLILGNSSVDVGRKFAVLSETNEAVPVSARRIGSAHTDPQESARRMILGAAVYGQESGRMRLSGIQKFEK